MRSTRTGAKTSRSSLAGSGGRARPQHAVPRVRDEVAELVGLAAGLVGGPQPHGEGHVLAGERAPEGLLALGAGGGRAGEREQALQLDVLDRDAGIGRDARDRAQLELEAIGGRQAAAVEQQVLADGSRRPQRPRAQRVQRRHAPAEVDGDADLVLGGAAQPFGGYVAGARLLGHRLAPSRVVRHPFRRARQQHLAKRVRARASVAPMASHAGASRIRRSLTIAGAVAACAMAATVSSAPAQEPDTTPPETTITSGPAEGEILNSDAPMFAWASSELNSTFKCVVDGARDRLLQRRVRHGRKPRTAHASRSPRPIPPATPTRRPRHAASRSASRAARCRSSAAARWTASSSSPRTAPTRAPARPAPTSSTGAAATTSCAAPRAATASPGSPGTIACSAAAAATTSSAAAATTASPASPATTPSTAKRATIASPAAPATTPSTAAPGAIASATPAAATRSSAGPGNDLVDARDTSRAGRRIADRVSCGSGRYDVALVDAADRVASDCERVRRPPARARARRAPS